METIAFWGIVGSDSEPGIKTVKPASTVKRAALVWAALHQYLAECRAANCRPASGRVLIYRRQGRIRIKLVF